VEPLIKRYERRLAQTSTDFVRYLHDRIDWKLRLIVITGGRGSGKSTMLLQRLKKGFPGSKKALYISLDDIWFETNTLLDLAEHFHEAGGRYLYIDEVHKYKRWSKELKTIYDTMADLRCVVTGSSALDILGGEADLSRRAAHYYLHGMSLREFMVFEKEIDMPLLRLDDILENHQEIAADFYDRADMLKTFKQFLVKGCYPFFKESGGMYLPRLASVVNLVLETDIPAIYPIDYSTVRNMRKLLAIISQSVPFKPNITNLSREAGINRNMVLKLIDILDHAGILIALRSPIKGLSYLTKPEKIFLDNTNLMHALVETPNIGHLRETFFLNQVEAVHEVHIPKYGDFLVDGKHIFEVGGSGKSPAQMADIPEAYFALDGIKGGSGKRIPLWLFGFLY